MKKLKAVARIVLIIALFILAVDVVRFPECYSAKWRYQLENDIKAGDEQAIDYYRRCYEEKGRYLYGENEL